MMLEDAKWQYLPAGQVRQAATSEGRPYSGLYVPALHPCGITVASTHHRPVGQGSFFLSGTRSFPAGHQRPAAHRLFASMPAVVVPSRPQKWPTWQTEQEEEPGVECWPSKHFVGVTVAFLHQCPAGHCVHAGQKVDGGPTLLPFASVFVRPVYVPYWHCRGEVEAVRQ